VLEVKMKAAVRPGGCGIAFVEACQEMKGFEAATIDFVNAGTLRPSGEGARPASPRGI
jgi:hypothetical protein